MTLLENNRITRRTVNEFIVLEAWGKDSIRVRVTPNGELSELPGALLAPVKTSPEAFMRGNDAVLRNGDLEAVLQPKDTIQFINRRTGEVLLQEQGQIPGGTFVRMPGRSWRHLGGGSYQARLEFLPAEERIYGLGQHAHGFLDNKGTAVDLYHRNTEFAIPFAVSSRNYGFLWNHPGTGIAEYALNRTVWTADSARQIDYWVTTGDTYADILERYAEATGKSPMMPEWAAGYWQCKLRYETQEELLEVAREHKRRGLPMDVIICDFFHWPYLGDFRFDPKDWPDPAAMVKELEALGIKLMVSVWPAVDMRSENHLEMENSGLLMANQAGIGHIQRYITFGVADEHAVGDGKKKILRNYLNYIDPTHPDTRAYVWDKIKQNYYDYGIKLFWIDCNEPEIRHTDYHNVRYHLGSGQEVTSLYPNATAQMICDGLTAQGETEIVSLSRSGWAGIQRYGAVLWSGDIESTFEELKRQITAGLNVSMSGVPWWNSDIGGFIKPKDRDDPAYVELLIRWFQYGAFCPVFRMHGMRSPNEVWTYGEEAYAIMAKYLRIRERLKPYILEQMRLAHEKGIPPMRPLFFDFESDKGCHAVSDQYLFGPDLLVAPVTQAGAVSRIVYLPSGETWTDMNTGETYGGGQTVTVPAPLNCIPVFAKGSGSAAKENLYDNKASREQGLASVPWRDGFGCMGGKAGPM
jgi:alpha-D-xyloside xylohydrolase